MSDMEETKGIRAAIILEVIGKPPEHLTETLNNLIEQIDKEEGIVIKEKKVNEPISIKEKAEIVEKDKEIIEHNDFHTSFAEIEVEVDEISKIVLLMFKYMPASIEIIYPEEIVLTNNGWSEILSEITRRLHGYEEITRVLQVEKAMMEKKINELISEKEKNN